MATAPLKRASIALVAVGALVASVAATSSPLVSTGAAETVPPNIVVVMSDDQPQWTVDEMPFVSSVPGLQPFGALYDNYAFCCPARATFLTGLYSHHTGVEQNRGGPFDDSSTLATWLDGAGYETGLFGKYLNQYPFDRGARFIPPGWDEWAALIDRGSIPYFGYKLNVNGETERFESEPEDYSTSVFSELATDFIETAPEPFFAFVTPHGPHAPFTPEPGDAGMSPPPDWPRSPNFNHVAEGAPAHYRDLPPVKAKRARETARQQLDVLLSVDRLTESVVTAADGRGDTIVLYLSDNGLSLGSHRFPGKRCGYEECGLVPGLIRAPGDPTDLLVSNADLAPTLADLAGVSTPSTDGRSRVDEMNAGTPGPDEAVLLRNKGKGDLPGFWGVRTELWKYLEHAPRAGSPRVELYDLMSDPDELTNRHGAPSLRATEAALAERLDVLRAAEPH